MSDPDIGLIEVAQREVDVEFMSKIAQQMHVPRHIRLGNGDFDKSAPPSVSSSGIAAAEFMSVPERISVAGPDDRRQPPDEIIIENRSLAQMRNAPFTLKTPPQTLTVHNGVYRTAVEELEARVSEKRSHSSEKRGAAGDEASEHANNLYTIRQGTLSLEQRVSLLDKQVTRLNTRLYQLEDELESVQYWQKIMICLGIGLVAVVALKSLLNR